KREKVPAIFGSEVFPSKVLDQIGREAGVRFVDTLRDDDLPGTRGSPEHSYIGMMLEDVRAMVTALGGNTTWKVIAKNGGREEDRAVRLERWREAPRLGRESGHTGGRLTCCQLPGFQRRLPKGWQGFATSFVARKVLSTSVALSPVLSSVRTRRCKA